MNKKTRKYLIMVVLFALIFFAFIISVLFSGGRKTITNSDSIYSSSSGPILAARRSVRSISACDTGFFYINGPNLYYHDFSSNYSYPICSDPKCKHSNWDCSSYVGGLLYNTSSLAYYNESVYYLRDNKDNQKLISMGVDGLNKKVVAEFSGKFTGKINDIRLYQPGYSFYYNDKAYINASYVESEDSDLDILYDIFIVDLKNGKITSFYDDHGIDHRHEVLLCGLSDKYMVLEEYWQTDGILSKKEFIKQKDSLNSDYTRFDHYSSYVSWYKYYSPQHVKYIHYDFSSDTYEEFYSDVIDNIPSNNDIGHTFDLVTCGLYDDYIFLGNFYNENDANEYYVYDIKTKEISPFEVGDDNSYLFTMVYESPFINIISKDGHIVLFKMRTDSELDYYDYDFNSKIISYLYTEKLEGAYLGDLRKFADTEKGYFLYNPHNGKNFTYKYIEKEYFYKGQIDKAIDLNCFNLSSF